MAFFATEIIFDLPALDIVVISTREVKPCVLIYGNQNTVLPR
jgi:hypothetical protein